ncbi:MAG: lytic transglycosylase domain-containing protein [Alphaproteobacteria bacterium]|nr:lytic transglycosylase domain-containing protein [Alphaproteobacteria bacterium]
MVKPLVIIVLLVVFALSGAVPAHASLLSDSDQSIYREAFKAADEDRWSRAHALTSGAHNHLLAKVLRWMDFVRPRSGASFEDITSFLSKNPDWPMTTALERRAEEAIGPGESSQTILAWFTTRSPLTADGKMALARALIATGKEDKAIQTVRESWVSDNFGQLQEKQFLSLFGQNLRREDHNARLDRLLWDRQTEMARRQLRHVDTEHQQLALARIALIELDGGAEAALRKVPAELRSNPGLLFDRVHWRRRKEHYDDAIALMNQPGVNKIRPDLWWVERAMLAREALQRGSISKAYDLARNHGKVEGSALVDAEWLAGWIALRTLRDAAAALNHFKLAYDAAVTPMSRSRGAYWAGRASEALGEKAEAEKWYRAGAGFLTVYYGQLSAERLDSEHKWVLPPDPAPSSEDIEAFNHNEVAQAAAMLGEIGAVEPLRHFVLRLTEMAKTPGQHALAAKLAAKDGRPDLGVNVARRAAQQSVILVGPGFPVIDVPVSEPPEKALVMAIIRQESNFHKEAVSVAGARGLMQLLPGTARQMARLTNTRFTPASLTSSASYNVTLGSAYLGHLLESFGKSYLLTVASYNAGPARVHQWIRELGDPRESVDVAIDWIESIPFNETRNYVQRVLEGVQIYRHRLGASKPSASLGSDLKR